MLDHRSTLPHRYYSQLFLLISGLLTLQCVMGSELTSIRSPARAEKSSTSMHPLAVAMVMALVALSAVVQETQAKCPSNDLTSCLPAAEADVQPSHECCTNLAAYSKTATPGECLCKAALTSTFGEDINVIPLYALQIPQKCSLRYPAGTTCKFTALSIEFCYVIPGGQ